ncbi:MAG: hypothetical protein ACR2QK_15220 [Acidimicrobiales bacterium]
MEETTVKAGRFDRWSNDTIPELAPTKRTAKAGAEQRFFVGDA